MDRHDLPTGAHPGRAGNAPPAAAAAGPRPVGLPRTDDAAAAATGPGPERHADPRTGTAETQARVDADTESGGRNGRATDRRASLVGRTLAELDADPAAGALRDRCAAATPGEVRALRGEWTAAVLRAIWRASAASGRETPLPAPANRGGARR